MESRDQIFFENGFFNDLERAIRERDKEFIVDSVNMLANKLDLDVRDDIDLEDDYNFIDDVDFVFFWAEQLYNFSGDQLYDEKLRIAEKCSNILSYFR